MNNSTLGIAEQIKQLKELLDIGAITQEDYDRKKDELLNGTFGNTNTSSTSDLDDKTIDVNIEEIIVDEPDFKIQFYKNLDLNLLKKKPLQALAGKAVGFLDMYFAEKGFLMRSPDWSDVKIDETFLAYDELKYKVTQVKIMVIYKSCFITIFINDTPITFYYFEDSYLDLSTKLGQKMVKTEAAEYSTTKTKGKELLTKLNTFGINID